MFGFKIGYVRKCNNAQRCKFNGFKIVSYGSIACSQSFDRALNDKVSQNWLIWHNFFYSYSIASAYERNFFRLDSREVNYISEKKTTLGKTYIKCTIVDFVDDIAVVVVAKTVGKMEKKANTANMEDEGMTGSS